MGPSALRQWARRLKRESLTVYFAARHPDTPWVARCFGLAVAAYALSPIDLIPDVIPVLGYLDDIILVPLGIWLFMRLVPVHVLAEARARAAIAVDRPTSRIAAIVIVCLWLAALAGVAWLALGWRAA